MTPAAGDRLATAGRPVRVLVVRRSAFQLRPMTDLQVYLRAAWAVRMNEDSRGSAFSCATAGAAAASSSKVARICREETVEQGGNFTDSSRSTGRGPWYLWRGGRAGFTCAR